MRSRPKISSISQYVPEFSDDFLSLFPHRWDYLYADHPRPGDRPDWRTEIRHPLSDRLIRQGACLYGVRFGAETQYLMLDIDRGSPYHPLCDRQAIPRMVATLEPIGLCSYLAVTSSRTGGIHVYLPFQQPVRSWELAAVVDHLLKQAGFTIEEGMLEIFPNQRNYDPDTTTLYQGHRLPLQDGSYLLTEEWQFAFTTPEHFVYAWRWCTSKNDIQPAALEPILKQARRKHSKLSHKGSKFLNDLNADIDVGWTGQGQTNFLLGRIAMREYIFGHLLRDGEPLEGDRLISAIVTTATALPGYRDYCRHQHEIWKRAEDWARCIENSRYWHWKQPKPNRPTETELEAFKVTWNSWQLQQARDRLRWAIGDLLDRGALPAGARARFLTLTRAYRFSGATLYHHRDLWHPEHLWNSPPGPPYGREQGGLDSPDGIQPPRKRSSLFATTERNTASSLGYRQFLDHLKAGSGCNTPLDKAFSDFVLLDQPTDHEKTDHQAEGDEKDP